ncbi:MAG: Asp23/Gls24 family envelope stress response protein [Eubacteriales bacterium]
MGATVKNMIGSIVFSEEVLANLAGLAAMECYGIVGMASKTAMDGIVQLFKGENLSKGVKVSVDGNNLSIHLYIAVKYGVSMPAVAENVVDTVKYKVEKLTGLSVANLDVTISDIRL